MEEAPKPQSNTVAIAKFFGMNGQDAMTNLKALTQEDKDQLGEGIRNGTLTY